MSVSFRSKQATQDDGTVVLELEGALDLIASPELKDLLSGLMESAPRLLIDLAQVHFVDSAGIGLLLAARKGMAARGKECALANATGQPRKLLRISGLDTLMKPGA